MSLLRNITSGLRSLFQKEQVDRELDEELRAYQEMAAEEKMKNGMSRKEALRAVRLEQGSVEVTKEVVRSGGWESFVETCWQDLRYAARSLRKSPGFTAVAVLTLALGIGANTAIFTVVDAVLLRPLPCPEPDRIMRVALVYKGQIGMSEFSAKQFEFWKNHSDPFQYLAATVTVGFNLGGVGTPERTKALRVSADYFQVFGVHPVLGREFLPEEDHIGGRDVAILSHGLRVRDFGADPNVIAEVLFSTVSPLQWSE